MNNSPIQTKNVSDVERAELLDALRMLNITHTTDGRKIDNVSRFTLLQTLINVRCDIGREI